MPTSLPVFRGFSKKFVYGFFRANFFAEIFVGDTIRSRHFRLGWSNLPHVADSLAEPKWNRPVNASFLTFIGNYLTSIETYDFSIPSYRLVAYWKPYYLFLNDTLKSFDSHVRLKGSNGNPRKAFAGRSGRFAEVASDGNRRGPVGDP